MLCSGHQPHAKEYTDEDKGNEAVNLGDLH